MANYCDYEVRVRGTEKAGLMVYASMPCMDYKDFNWKKDAGSYTTVCFSGNCKWSVNFGVTDSMDRVNLDAMSETEIERNGIGYENYSLRAKSEAFQCEIMVHYWSVDSGFDQFDHYKNGKILKQRKIEFNYDRQDEFDWDKLEFVGHEGEYDESVDGEAQDENLMAMLLGLNGVGLSQHESQMSNEFDMYDWSFTEGKRVAGNGWTIAIPDGYERINTSEKNIITGQTRLFALVPATYMGEEYEYNRPIDIVPGGVQDINGMDDIWMVHPNARAAVAGIAALTAGKKFSNVLGTAPELLSTGWSDVAAYILVQETSENAYAFQIMVLTENKGHSLRVSTGAYSPITDSQKEQLKKSVVRWLHTMKFDKPNKACPTHSKMEEDSLVEEIVKNGVTKKLDEAIDQAQRECAYAINVKNDMLQFMIENGLIFDYVEEYIKEFLTDAMEVKVYYLEKADELIKKLQNRGVNQAVIIKILKKLYDLKDDLTSVKLDGKVVEIELPPRVKEIRERWEEIEIESFLMEENEAGANRKTISRENRIKIEKNKKMIAELKSQIDDLEKEKAQVSSELSSLEYEYEHGSDKYYALIDEIDKKKDELNVKKSKIDSEIQPLEERLALLKKDIANLEAKRNHEGAIKIEELKRIAAKYEIQSMIVQDYLKQINTTKTNQRLKSRYTKKVEQTIILRNSIEMKNKEIGIIYGNLDSVKIEENALQNLLETAQLEKKKIECEIENEKKQSKKAKKDYKNMRSKYERLQTKEKNNQEKIDSCNEKIKELQDEIRRLEEG